MKFKNLNKKKLLVILLSSFVITSFSGCKNNSYNETKTPTYDYTIENETTNDEIKENTKDDSSIEENISKIEYSENDLIVINEFERLEEEINEILENDKEFLVQAKGIFITIIDFIFYDSEINGVKFDDLTDAGKQKILEISTNIDTKIENKFPNYKDEISEKATNALNKASELIKEGSTNLGEFTKEKLGDENYNNLIEAKDELVYYTNNAIDIIGDFSSDLYDKGKEKIKNWYEEFKNN